MDRRAVFVLVFIVTFVSTALVAIACLWSKQSLLTTALYSLATMWIMGIVAQLAIHHLWETLIRPMENSQQEQMVASSKAEEKTNLNEIENIDQILAWEERRRKEVMEMRQTKDAEKAKK